MIRRLVRGLLRRAGLGPGAPDTVVPAAEAGDGPVRGVELQTCTLFYSFLRLHGIAAVQDARLLGPGALRAGFAVRMLCDGATPQQKFEVVRLHQDGSVEFTVEALVDRARPVEGTVLELSFGGVPTVWPLAALMPAAQARDLRSLMPDFQQAVAAHVAKGARPRMLDIGGRARSQVQRSELFPDCDVTVMDIVADPGVDVVGDAHELSRLLPAESFDFAMSISVFEHLLMPWKVAVEMNRVMRTGGIALIHTHQTIGMHDMPWDFLRFSDAAWAGIFNRYTGFEVVKTDMSRFLHVVPSVLLDPAVDFENAGGFECSTVMVRKTGPALVEWPVPLGEVVKTSYPQGADAHLA